jgi:hypothetical protein
MKLLPSHTIITASLIQGIDAFAPALSSSCNRIHLRRTSLTHHHHLFFTAGGISDPTIVKHPRNLGTTRYMSSPGKPVTISQIDKKGLYEIIEDIESTSREESGYVVIGKSE